MNYKTAITYIIDQLKAIYDKNESENIAYLLVEHCCKQTKLQLLTSQYELSIAEIETLKNKTVFLQQHVPIQHVLGEQYFYGLKFLVNEQVLIPRPETEELVDIILKNNKNKKHLQVLDIGTGSGCIAISLQKNLQEATVFASDTSASALAIARQNAVQNKASVLFLENNILTEELPIPKHSIDIIVSNPPYIMEAEKEAMHNNVLLHEPHLALFVSNGDALQFYKKITQIAVQKLQANGQLYFEINEAYGKEVADLLIENNFTNVQIVQDMQGKDRIVLGNKQA